MQQWMDRTIEKAGKRIHYYYYSLNRPNSIIFLPGFMDNGLCYERIAEPFTSNFDIYLFDARGHGQSSDPPPNATYKDLIEDIHDLCVDLHLSNVIVVGHSMGGVEAALFAAEYPDIVKKVVLEDPGFAPKLHKITQSLGCLFLSMVMWHQDEPASLEKHQKRAKRYNPKWHERDQLVWGQAQREFRMHYPGKNLKILGTGAAFQEILPRIKAPILLVTSEHGIVKKKTVKKMQELVPSIKWEYIPKAGHNIRREQFDLYITILKKFLNG